MPIPLMISYLLTPNDPFAKLSKSQKGRCNLTRGYMRGLLTKHSHELSYAQSRLMYMKNPMDKLTFTISILTA